MSQSQFQICERDVFPFSPDCLPLPLGGTLWLRSCSSDAPRLLPISTCLGLLIFPVMKKDESLSLTTVAKQPLCTCYGYLQDLPRYSVCEGSILQLRYCCTVQFFLQLVSLAILWCRHGGKLHETFFVVTWLPAAQVVERHVFLENSCNCKQRP